MVARIDHERAEREALEQQRQELLKRKAKLIAENKKRKDDLANLDKDLERFIDVRIPNYIGVTGSYRGTLWKYANLSRYRPPSQSRSASKKSSEMPIKSNPLLNMGESSPRAYADKVRKRLLGLASTSLTIWISNYFLAKCRGLLHRTTRVDSRIDTQLCIRHYATRRVRDQR